LGWQKTNKYNNWNS